ncbi:MAG: periplasmic heavy metal sensor [Myxococcales bacterium]|nr:periplasmic heavy metal sensor [Myxococcales bacterium]
MCVSTVLTVLAALVATRIVARLVMRRCHGGGGRFGFGRSRKMRWLFRFLDTTPGQEKVIRSALEEAFGQAWSARNEAREQRGNLAEAFRSEALDGASFTAAREGARAAFERAEGAFVEAMRKVHDVLDPMQRERLARLLDSRFGRGPLGGAGGFGPYRGGPVSL